MILEFVQQRDAQGEKSCLESLSFKAENDNMCHCQSCQQELDYMEQMVTTEKQTTVTALMHFSVRLLNRNDNSVLALWYGIPGPIGDRALKATLGHSRVSHHSWQ